MMETFYFTKDRLHQVVEMPYPFVLFTLVAGNLDTSEADRYGSNTQANKAQKEAHSAETFAKFSNDEKFENFFDSWDKETQNFVLLMKETQD